MKYYKLTLSNFYTDCKYESDGKIAKGFKEAEKKAKELLKEHPKLKVYCTEYNFVCDYFIREDCYTLKYNEDGDECWVMSLASKRFPYEINDERILTSEEQQCLKDLRNNEEEILIEDLSDVELRLLYNEVNTFSCWLHDYVNSLDVDPYSVMRLCDLYLDWLYEEKEEENNEETFVRFFREYYYE